MFTQCFIELGKISTGIKKLYMKWKGIITIFQCTLCEYDLPQNGLIFRRKYNVESYTFAA